MDRSVREIAITGLEKVRGIRHIVRRDLMGKIHDPGLGIDVEDDALHAGDEIVALAEIRQQRDERDRYRHDKDQTRMLEGGSGQIEWCGGIRVDIGGYNSSKRISITSYSTTFAGVVTSTMSPTRLPMRARPTGDWTEMRENFKSASSCPTRVYCFWLAPPARSAPRWRRTRPFRWCAPQCR